MESIITGHSPLNDLDAAQAFRLVSSFLVLAILLPFLLHLHHDFLAFVALGPGGTPSTVAGYMRVKVLSFFALSDPYTPTPIPRRSQSAPGYLRALAKRVSPRPVTRGIAPHRQITQKASQAHYQKLQSAIEAIAASDSSLKVRTSCFEKYSTGLFSTAPVQRTCGGEICHAHPSDGSMHLTLHPADAKIVMEAGWAERHPLARGGWFERFVPGGFLMVYAPREESDVEALMQVVKAAVWYVNGGGAVEDSKDDCGRRDSGYVLVNNDVSAGGGGEGAEEGGCADPGRTLEE
ncbi:hypothetical protein LTR53_003087 [Teratosphaeriaceae sp. CCFEE 6253]|nr:hypothetical protein LTR53_003087 [Teratosphaeriaceae sp. CCFEE 6253]